VNHVHDIAIDPVAWQEGFSRGALRRGLNYADEGRVLDIVAMGRDGRVWMGLVQGSHAEPYQALAVLGGPECGELIRSSCTCPMGGQCKHVAATLFQLTGFTGVEPATVGPDDDEDEAGEVWSHWLRSLEATPPDHFDTHEERERSFGIMLRAATHGRPPQLMAAPVWLKRGKRGGLIDPQSPALHHVGVLPCPPGGWPDEDQAPLALLVHRAYERFGKVVMAPIHDRASELALTHLLARYPAYFQRGDTPLKLGPDERLELAWQMQDDGSQRLGYRLRSGEAQVLRGNGLWYVMPARGLVGRIEDSAHWLDRVARAPLLKPEHVAIVGDRLKASGMSKRIPAPAPGRDVRIVSGPPRGVLVLRAESVGVLMHGDEDLLVMGVARLAFDYHGHRVALDDPPTPRQLADGEVVEIRRDRRIEAALMERLSAAGLRRAREMWWEIGLDRDTIDAADLVLRPARNRPPAAPAEWLPMLDTLRQAGFIIEHGAGFEKPRREARVGAWDVDIAHDGGAWFDLSLGIEIDGERADLLPILGRVLADPRFPLKSPKRERKDATWTVPIDEDREVKLPVARLRELLQPLLDWLDESPKGAVRLHAVAADLLDGVDSLTWRGDGALRQRLAELRATPRHVDVPASFAAELRPYQRDGLDWLGFLAESGLGGVLADDMGLGKTVQVLAHMLVEKARLGEGFRCLVVAPTSLMGNWHDEAARFAPSLRVLVLHGPARGDRYDEIAQHDLILTTYPLLPRDRERLLEHRFSLLVLDEAQAIKNPKSQAARVVREIQADRRLGMTGTPLENHLGELWAQFDAIEPGLLGSARQFNRLFRTPIEKQGDSDAQVRLNRRIASLLLRRRKEDVLDDLPEKTEIVHHLELEGGQRELYETLRLAQHERVQEAIAERGLAQSGIVVLDALLKLRQACCDPRLVKLDAARKVSGSAKLEAALEMIEGLLAEDRKVLLFSQFTSMLALIGDALDARKVSYLKLTGDTPGTERADLVRRFQEGEAPLFMISLKAGGVGLNLTAADTVIHYDPWWNPAVEAQATDRAHRIGQDKPVFVYRLICRGTVEEKIQGLQARKSDLAQAVLEGGSTQKLAFSEEDLGELFAPL
jgi:superfamily II DNA or RNA helicase